RVPMPKPRDVLIRMHFAEVGDWDILVRERSWPMKRPFPLILGLAGAGPVAAIGGNVENFAESDVVYTSSYPLQDQFCHKFSWHSPNPDSIGVEQGGSSSS